MENIKSVLQLLNHGNQLKRIARSGWVMRGVSNAEDVAAHSYGVAFTAMVLAQYVKTEKPLDMGRLLQIAILHDLPEGVTTDIPSPAWRYLPAGIKYTVERSAMQEILGDLDEKEPFMALWEELHENQTAEAKLVHDADKVDMYLQASIYQAQNGNSHLSEFWTKRHQFHFPISQAIYDHLRALATQNS